MEPDYAGWQVAVDVADAEVYPVLEQDRVWNCFAIADVALPFRAYSQFAVAYETSTSQRAACLVLRHPQFAVVSPYGAEQGVAAILAQLDARLDLPERTHLHALSGHRPLLEQYYRASAGWRQMLRMALQSETVHLPASLPCAPVERLTPADLQALLALYQLYPESVFRADLVEHGIFYGVRDGDRLIASGGTHVVVPAYGIAVLGSIFTHPEARGRGYARAITAALVADLVARGCRDIALTVAVDNRAAIHVCTRLRAYTHAPQCRVGLWGARAFRTCRIAACTCLCYTGATDQVN
jgi:ribosomal protein S18 acetylase RimI-like enzyme